MRNMSIISTVQRPMPRCTVRASMIASSSSLWSWVGVGTSPAAAFWASSSSARAFAPRDAGRAQLLGRARGDLLRLREVLGGEERVQLAVDGVGGGARDLLAEDG